MAIRGEIVIECDTPTCHAELVIPASHGNVANLRRVLSLEFLAADWVQDDDGGFHCPDCCDPDDERGGRRMARDFMRDLAG